ncbi:MAG: NmrA/HSCARG family protein [Gemmatimonadaceae bacterium]
MSSPKIIAVIGATGAQGGGLVHAILNDPTHEFACRAITRTPGTDAARVLMIEGAELVQADLDDVESLTEAFTGAYGAFCVTNFWEHFSGEKERAQAKNLADAARAAGVRHVVWSTLEDTRKYMDPADTRMPMLQETYRVPHFDAKGEGDEYFRGLPVTLMRTSFYWDNIYAFGLGPKKGDDGAYSWSFPMGDKPLAGIASEDIGKVAFGIFKAGDRFIGKDIGIASEFVTIKEMGEGITEALDCGPIAYHDVSADAYRALGFPGADELGNMFQVYRDFAEPFNAARDPGLARELNPEMLTYKGFLEKYKHRIPV